MDYYSSTNQAANASSINNNIASGNSRGSFHGAGGGAGGDHASAHGERQAQQSSVVTLQGSFMQMKIQPLLSTDGIQNLYPLRPDQPDCAFYLRNGTCSYGTNCRYNHPPFPKMEGTPLAANVNQTDPEVSLQSECPYYAKTGTCKFGASCKYHHSQQASNLLTSEQPQLNFLGLPLRPGIKECLYYIRNGSCKFGVMCKFHHPQPAAVGSVPSPGSPFTSSSTHMSPVHVPYQPALPPWLGPRPAYVSQGSPLPYMPVLISSPPVGLWNAYQGPANPVPCPDTWTPAAMTKGIAHPPFQPSREMQGIPEYGATFINVAPRAGGMPQWPQCAGAFPQRPGQPDCHLFMKTGECKFGPNCKYNHPKSGAFSSCHTVLNPMGLPFRLGQPACTYYIKHGKCKYGSVCKFDHPVTGLRLNLSASSLNEAPIFPYSSGSSPTNLVAMSSEKFGEATKVDASEQSSLVKPSAESFENI